MKKRISGLVVLILILLIGLIGCKDNKETHSNHVFGEWEVTRKATCATPGIETRTCECGEKETRELEMLMHTEVVDAAVEPTCTTPGKTEGSHCSACSKVIKEQNILPAAHQEETLKAIAVTCTRAGKAKGSKCSVCGEIIVRQKKIRATGHNYQNGSCTKCGKHLPDTAVAVNIDNLRDTAPANFITKKAYAGGTTLSFSVFVPEGVTWWSVNWTTDASDIDLYTAWEGVGKEMKVKPGSWQECSVTLPDDGNKYYLFVAGAVSEWNNKELLIDDAVITDKNGKVLGEDNFDNGIDAGLFDVVRVNEYTGMAAVYESERCAEHIIVTDKKVTPTCDEAGKTEGSHCSACGKVIVKQETIAALGHEWNSNNKCTVCGKDREDLVAVLAIDNLNENAPMNFITKEVYPGGSTISFSIYTPAVKNAKLDDGSYTWWGISWTTNPTETDIYQCFSNGRAYWTSEGGQWKDYTVTLPDDNKEYYIYFAGAMSEWGGKELQMNNFVVKDSTGKVVAEDSFDDGVENGLFDVIATNPLTDAIVVYDRVMEVPCKDGHTIVTDKGYEPNCTEPGLSDGSHCSVCGVVLEAQESVPATGHDYGDDGICDCGETMKDRAVAINIDALNEVENMNFITRAAYAGGSTISFKAFVPSGTTWWTISYTTNPADSGLYDWLDGTGKTQPSSYDQWQEYSLTLPDDGNTYYFYITGAKSEWGGKELLIDNVKITNKLGEVVATDDFNYGMHSGIFTIREEGYNHQAETETAVREYIIGDLCMHPIDKHTKENDIAATCADTGIVGRTYCSACGETLIEEVITPALGHNYDNGACTVCGEKEANRAMMLHMEYQKEEPTQVVTKNAYSGGKMTFVAYVPEGITGSSGWWGVAPTKTESTSIYTIAGGYSLFNESKVGQWAEYEVTIPSDGNYYLAIGGATGTNGNDWAGKQLLIDNVKIYDASGNVIAEDNFNAGYENGLFNVATEGWDYIAGTTTTAVELYTFPEEEEETTNKAMRIYMDHQKEEPTQVVTKNAYSGGKMTFEAYVPEGITGGTGWWGVVPTTSQNVSIYTIAGGYSLYSSEKLGKWAQYEVTIPNDGQSYYLAIGGATGVSDWSDKELLIDNVKIYDAAGNLLAEDNIDNGFDNGLFKVTTEGWDYVAGTTTTAVDLYIFPIEEETVVNKALQMHMEYQKEEPTQVVTKNAYSGGKMTFEAYVPEGITGSSGWWGVAPTKTESTSIYTIASGYSLFNENKVGQWAEYEVTIPSDGNYYLAIGGATGTNGNDWASKQLLIDNVKIYDASGNLIAEDSFDEGFADGLFTVREMGWNYITGQEVTAVDLYTFPEPGEVNQALQMHMEYQKEEPTQVVTKNAYSGGKMTFEAYVPEGITGGTGWWGVIPTKTENVSIYAIAGGYSLFKDSKVGQWAEYEVTIPSDGNYYLAIGGATGTNGNDWAGKQLLIDNVKIYDANGNVIAEDSFNEGFADGLFTVREMGWNYITGQEVTAVDLYTFPEPGEVNQALQMHMEYQKEEPTQVVTKNAYSGGKMTFEAYVPEGITGGTGWWGVVPTKTENTSIYTIASGYSLFKDSKVGQWAEYEVTIPSDGNYYLAIGGATGTNGNDWAGKQLLIDNVKIYDASGNLIAEDNFDEGFADGLFTVREMGWNYVTGQEVTAVDLYTVTDN